MLPASRLAVASHDYDIIAHTDNQCNICYSSSLDNTVFLPCFHHLCYNCYIQLQNHTCPWCRYNFESDLQISNSSTTNDCNSILLEQQIFIIENRINRREKKRKYRKNKRNNLQRHTESIINHTNYIINDDFYEFYILFNTCEQEISDNKSNKACKKYSDSHNNHSDKYSNHHGKINHRLNKYSHKKQRKL